MFYGYGILNNHVPTLRSTVMGGVAVPPIVTTGLLMHLDAGDSFSYSGSGTTWVDLSNNLRNGTLLNGVAYSSSNLGSLIFDGVNDYITLSNISAALTNKTSFTYDTWFKCNNTSSAALKTLFSFGNNPNYSNDILFGVTNNTILLQVNNGADNGATCTFTSTGWSNLVIIYDGTQTGNSNRLKAYINGSSTSLNFGTYTVPSSTSSTTQSNSAIGAYSVGPFDNFFNGNIATAKIYDRAITGSEAVQNFNSLKTRYGL